MARGKPAKSVKPDRADKDTQVRRSFPELPGITKEVVEFKRGTRIFSQGEPAPTVLYIQAGTVRLSVLNHTGKEAVVAMLGPGDFLGEGALAAQRARMCTATAIAPVKVMVLSVVLHD